MLNWSDSTLARLRREEMVREAELDRLASEAAGPRSSLAQSLRRAAPQLAAIAVAFGAIAFLLR
ncbi:MAG TPA: hypothetical protein VFA01_03065 [Candidatus Dormibacteraeota bacterium]|jgi:hypothetical protein|nr:hypothetical protein [Candidatus Dormibacteraeota bacterium]